MRYSSKRERWCASEPYPLTGIVGVLSAPYNHEKIMGIIPKIAIYRPRTFVWGIPWLGLLKYDL